MPVISNFRLFSLYQSSGFCGQDTEGAPCRKNIQLRQSSHLLTGSPLIDFLIKYGSASRDLPIHTRSDLPSETIFSANSRLLILPAHITGTPVDLLQSETAIHPMMISPQPPRAIFLYIWSKGSVTKPSGVAKFVWNAGKTIRYGNIRKIHYSIILFI